MPVYLVSCALNDPGHDYAPFWHMLEASGARRAMEAVWLLDTSAPLDAVTQSILPYLTSTDRLFVGEIGAWSATHLLEGATTWLTAHKP